MPNGDMVVSLHGLDIYRDRIALGWTLRWESAINNFLKTYACGHCLILACFSHIAAEKHPEIQSQGESVCDETDIEFGVGDVEVRVWTRACENRFQVMKGSLLSATDLSHRG
jgi:hypothetical protein